MLPMRLLLFSSNIFSIYIPPPQFDRHVIKTRYWHPKRHAEAHSLQTRIDYFDEQKQVMSRRAKVSFSRSSNDR